MAAINMPPKLPRKPDPKVAKLLGEVREWCEEKYGRRIELANALGVKPSRITDWLNGRTEPSLAIGLKLIAFLKARQSQKPESPDRP
ncbi:MAG: helix-turn-helix transcriptional regulator [Verrucomicrobia bacterium]|nr:helix-turn-helix transcriptional regulator [Verrucomicrobiota bacterium]